MRKLILFPVFMLALACNDGTLVQPEDNPTVAAAAAAAKTRPFSTTLTWLGPVGPAEFRQTGNVARQCGGNRYGHSGDLVGTAIHTGCTAVNSLTGKGTGEGELTIDLTEAWGDPVVGGFEGEWLAWIDGTVWRVKWWCKGYGDFEGMKLDVNITFDWLSPPPLVADGVIFDPQGP